MKNKLSELSFKILKFISSFLPLKNTILFESNPDFSDNTLFVYQEMLKRGLNKKYKFVWALNGSCYPNKLPEKVIAIKRGGSLVDRAYYRSTSSRAKIIIDSNIFIHKVRKEQIRVHLKHGLPMKDSSVYNKRIGDVDVLCVPSDYWVNICAQEHGLDSSKIKPLGFPRNDVLVPQPHKNKTIIWMPTYRKHFESKNSINIAQSDSDMPFGLPCISSLNQLQEINKLFKDNDAYLLIRLHPVQDTSGINLAAMSNIKICNDDFIKSNNTTLYKILTCTDALISDYSSIYYDYLLLDKPIALATADFEHYKKNNGILADSYEDFQKLFPAVFVENYNQLINFFNDVFKEKPDIRKCAEAKEKYMGTCDNRSAEKIVDYMIQNYNL